MDLLLRRLVRVGVRKGMSGSRTWLALAIVALGLRALRKLSHPSPEVIYRTELHTGDRFEIGARPA
jgi:hypothetical protein